jgi:coproporphyrinogen III oxidase
MSTPERAEEVLAWLKGLQDRLCETFSGPTPASTFLRDPWERDGSAGGLAGRGITAVQEGGEIMERAGVALSDVRGTKLPPAATARNPHLAGREFRAMGVSVVMHPRNPWAPTSHMNVRYFSAGDVWWFGGGFDLTPYLPYEEDARDWHRAAHRACASVDERLYPWARQWCDEYFFLRHRGEARGIGGIFFDDLNEGSTPVALRWEDAFRFLRAVGDGYLEAYRQVIGRRASQPFTERERAYQLYRRGRYVEFNLVLDRGTLFGLQSGGRTDSILMSMPPEARWSYRSPDPELDAKLLPLLTTRRGEDWLAR